MAPAADYGHAGRARRPYLHVAARVGGLANGHGYGLGRDLLVRVVGDRSRSGTARR